MENPYETNDGDGGEGDEDADADSEWKTSEPES